MALTPTDANIRAVRVGERGADPRLSWDSSDPPGTVFQVYVDGRRVWSGTARSVPLALPSREPGSRYRVNVLAVDPADARADHSGLLPPADGGGDRATLFWYGGLFLDPDLLRFDVFQSAAAGGPVDASRPVAAVAAYAKGVPRDGAGVGPAGVGGAGAAATVYAWTSRQLASGVWSFEVVPVTRSGVRGAPLAFTHAVSRPPLAPPYNPAAGRRVWGSYAPTTRLLTLSWLPSPP